MLIKDLPEDLKKLALDRQEQQRGDRIEDKSLTSAFVVRATPEGGYFWRTVDNGKFDIARELLDRKKGNRTLDHLVLEGELSEIEVKRDVVQSKSGEEALSEGVQTAPLTPQEVFDNLPDVATAEDEEADRVQRVFESGSKRDDDSNKPLVNHFDAYCRLRFGYRLRDGATKYDKGNWRKLQPDEAALEALNRHLAYYELNMQNEVEQDEDHLAGIIFNVMLLMKNEEKRGVKPDHFYGTTK